MKTVHFVIVLLYSIYTNVAVVCNISCKIFFRLRYPITKINTSDDAFGHQRNYRRRNSLTDLHEAVLINCEKSVQDAIISGVPIDLADHTQQTALYYACQRGFMKIVQNLLEHGARHNISDINRITPLWIAAREGHADVVMALLHKGAHPDHKAHDGTTALYQSSYEGHEKCVYHLIAYGACVSYAKNSGATPLFVASRNGHHRIAKHLLEHGADPTQTQEDLRSPLHTALLYNRVQCVELLLGIKIDYSSQSDIYGWSHLHFLAKRGSIEAAEVFFNHLRLLEKPVELNQKDLFGNTALHIAIFNKKEAFADYLIGKGFDENQLNSFGWTHKNYLSQYRPNSKIEETLPKLYLHNILKTHLIRYTSEEELIRDEIEAYVKELVQYIEKLNPLFRSNIIRSGSYYERTRVGLPDEFDYMINLLEIEHLCKFVENDFDPSGYGRLYPIDTNEAKEKLVHYLEPITQGVSSEKIRKQFYQLLTSARCYVIRKETSIKFHHLKFEWTSGDKRCGTAIHAEWYGVQYPCLSIKIDVVPCLTVYSWPQSATIKCPLEKAQFQIIARSPKENETYLWRISMSQTELMYFQSLPSEQINGYLSLKSLRVLIPYNCKISQVVYTADDLITSYMFKNEFLYERLRYPHREQWINGSLIHRVSGILKRLHKHLLLGIIQSFYIKNYNVIDENDHQRFRSYEIKYVRLLLTHLKQKIEAMNKKFPRRHTISTIESITQKHMLRERAFSNIT